MSDINNLFSTVATATVDPSDAVEGDLERGRQALSHDRRQRRIRRSVAGVTTAAGITAVAIVASQLGGPAATPSRHPQPNAGVKNTRVAPTTKHPTVSVKRVKLVDYTGDQLPGFTVDKVPAGWFLSTSSPFALLIDPNGDQDNDPDAFVGKLAVLTGSSDVHHLPPGTPVTVNGEDGTISDQGKYGLSLSYNTANGIGVVIQAPPTLNWTDDQLVSFATGVHMTGDAIATKG